MLNKKKIIASAVFIAMLSACSSEQDRKEANSDFKYLDTPELKPLVVGNDMVLPTARSYMLPALKSTNTGLTGDAVDIRPPTQMLEVIAGTRTDYRDGVGYLISSSSRALQIWQQTLKTLTEKSVPLLDKTKQSVLTDWVVLGAVDEDALDKFAVQYKLEYLDDRHQGAIALSLNAVKIDKQEVDLDANQRQRYVTQAMNYLMLQYDYMKQLSAQQEAEMSMQQVPMALGVNSASLPVIIARAPFDVFWEKLPTMLHQLGMSIDDKILSQGRIELTYSSLGQSELNNLGLDSLQLDGSVYVIKLGDLENRTSLSMVDSAGKPLSKDAMQSLLNALQAVK